MLIPFLSYLGHTSNKENIPNPRSEEYRYSKIVNALCNAQINPQEQGEEQEITVPWESDYIFSNSNTSKETNPSCSIFDLNPHFRLQNNFFKNYLFEKNPHINVITLSRETPELTLSFIACHAILNDTKIAVNVEKNTHAILHLKTISDETSILFPFILANVDENSTLQIRYWPSEKTNKGILCPWIETVVHKESQMSFCTFSKDINLHRITFIGYSVGSHSDISLHSAFSMSDKESADLFIRIYHEAPMSTSNQHINTVVFDNAKMNFNAQIAANNNTEKISAYQMFKGLILGKGAGITARPQLDIEYYDLACSHGVSIGKFTTEEVFYLKSRGLNEKEIYRILTYGFLIAPFVNFEPNDPWIKQIKEKLIVFL